MKKVVQFNHDSNVFAEDHTKKIKDCITQIKNDFIYIGLLLWEIREYKYYEYYGYKSVTEYGDKELLLEKSVVTRLIKLCENYSNRVRGTEYPSMTIADAYKPFNEGQLIAMLSVPTEKRMEVKPEMTVKEIRTFAKKCNDKSCDVATHEVGQTDCETLVCSNCGERYPVNPENKKQWIVINGKPVFSCCFQIKWDVDLLKND